MFDPILNVAQLPIELKHHETLQLEFKRTASETDAFEIAKDIAAMANSRGGTILVGAAQDGVNARLGRYEPLQEPESAAFMRKYEEAARDRIRPSPLIDVRKIAKDQGFIVAVNVWPFAGQPLAAQAHAPPGSSREAAFRFPIRVGTQTNFILPEQLPMMFLPEIRRISILLGNIPEEQRSSVELRVLEGADGGPWKDSAIPVRLEYSLENMMRHNVVRFVKCGSDLPYCVPVEAIAHVWKVSDDLWIIRANVTFRPTNTGAMVARPITPILRKY